MFVGAIRREIFHMLVQNSLILGVDPGSHITGYAYLRIHKHNPHSMSDFSLHSWGVIRAPRRLSFVERLGYLHHELYDLIIKERPQHCVIEDTFARVHHRSALKLSQARGALIAAAAHAAVPIYEITAPRVKKAITGKGNAEKHEVALFLRMLLRSSKPVPKNCPEDATDAMALALAWGIESSMKRRLISASSQPYIS